MPSIQKHSQKNLITYWLSIYAAWLH
jgi:hypothetical protein